MAGIDVSRRSMNDIRYCENFAPDAEQVRAAVIAGEFASHVGPDGALYTGISEYSVPHWQTRIARLWNKEIIPRLSCFRLNLKGELPHSWVHSDDICAKFASVLYLNTREQCSGGTTFWRHKELRMDRLPSREGLSSFGVDSELFYKRVESEWKRLEAWEPVTHVPMVWNRFITYSTSLFHSRFPHEAFGSGPQDGRLIWICFYDLADEVNK